MSFYATYSIGEPMELDGGGIAVGIPRDGDEGFWDTIFYHARIFRQDDEEKPELVGSVRIRRVLISKIINEGRSVYLAMDQVDQYEYEIFEAVWNEGQNDYKEELDAPFGDLIIFEPLGIVEGTVLHGFDINMILDDMAYHVGGNHGLIYFDLSYADFVQFNIDACTYLPKVGYVRSTHYPGLAGP